MMVPWGWSVGCFRQRTRGASSRQHLHSPVTLPLKMSALYLVFAACAFLRRASAEGNAGRQPWLGRGGISAACAGSGVGQSSAQGPAFRSRAGAIEC
jgi:hypothetical protein